MSWFQGCAPSCSGYATNSIGSLAKSPGALLFSPAGSRKVSLMFNGRGTIYPILNRLGVDSLVGRMTRFREDDRFKAISPEAIVLPYAPPTGHAAAPGVQTKDNTAEVWFDWAFVDFWKSNYCKCQLFHSPVPPANE